MATIEKPVPTLAAGQRLSRDEFLRRWEAMPELKRAELIKGVVYMPSPTSIEHSDSDSDIGLWLGTYALHTPGTKGGHAATTFMLSDAPQPDKHLRIVPEAGGRTRTRVKRRHRYLEGGPELIAEISLTSADYDLHDKLEVYDRAGVLEYLVILVEEREIRWFYRPRKSLVPMPTPPDGIWRSRIFPGLGLNGPCFLAGDMTQVIATLQQGLQTPEHAAFAKQLAARLKS